MIAGSTTITVLDGSEELQDLDELFVIVVNLLENAIESNNLNIAFSYLDYSTRLSSMINNSEATGGILLFLLRHAENLKDTKKVELVNKYFNDLGLKPKKYKKDYESLMKRQKEHLKERFEPEEVPELVPVSEPELAPVSEPELTPEIRLQTEPEEPCPKPMILTGLSVSFPATSSETTTTAAAPSEIGQQS